MVDKRKKTRKQKTWVQTVDKEIQADKTEGSFGRQAKRAGMTTHAFGEKIVRDYKKKSKHTALELRNFRRANLSLTFEKMAKKRKGKK